MWSPRRLYSGEVKAMGPSFYPTDTLLPEHSSLDVPGKSLPEDRGQVNYLLSVIASCFSLYIHKATTQSLGGKAIDFIIGLRDSAFAELLVIITLELGGIPSLHQFEEMLRDFISFRLAGELARLRLQDSLGLTGLFTPSNLQLHLDELEHEHRARLDKEDETFFSAVMCLWYRHDCLSIPAVHHQYVAVGLREGERLGFSNYNLGITRG